MGSGTGTAVVKEQQTGCRFQGSLGLKFPRQRKNRNRYRQVYRPVGLRAQPVQTNPAKRPSGDYPPCQNQRWMNPGRNWRRLGESPGTGCFGYNEKARYARRRCCRDELERSLCALTRGWLRILRSRRQFSHHHHRGSANLREGGGKRTGHPFDPNKYPECLRITAPSLFALKVCLPKTNRKCGVERSVRGC